MSTAVGHHSAEHSAASPAGDTDALEALIHSGGEKLRERMARIELHLERVMAAAGAPLAEHASATIMAGGKRLRPLLVVLAAEFAGSDLLPPTPTDLPGPSSSGRSAPLDTDAGDECLIRAAVAVELVHSATLVHDDVIDGAQLRRGRPTVAAGAGRQVAVATVTCCSRARLRSSRVTKIRPSCARSRMPALPSPRASCSSERMPTRHTWRSSAT